MSKKNKKQKRSAPAKKKSPVKPIVIACAAALTVAVIIAVIAAVRANTGSAQADLRNTSWLSQTAKNASGDEVDIREVYNTKYSNYQGRLSFDNDGRFELWLSPGLPEDGTHTGSYTVENGSVNAVFDDGTESVFTLNGTDSNISSIELNYDGYTVGFTKE